MPGLLDLGPNALAVTGDHATPAKLKSHSWHGVPPARTPIYSADGGELRGAHVRGRLLGVFAAEEIMGLLTGHALKLNRYGA